MVHTQNTPRGLLVKQAIGFGSTGIFATNYSEGTAIMTCDSTGVVDFAGSISIGGSGENIAQDSTGIDLPGTLTLGGEAGEDISQDSTGLDLPGTLTLGGQAGKDISQNSTSFFLPGSFSFVSPTGGTAILLAANSTGFTIKVGTGAAAQISTA